MIITIEGTDASGKGTQIELLAKELARQGKKALSISFPRYQTQGAAPAEAYLHGAFGNSPNSLNAYAASTLFAVDRLTSYHTEWKKELEQGTIILLDRYTTSNLAHQAVKIADDMERTAFLAWLEDFEYNKLGLPRPDKVIFLDMPPEFSQKLRKARGREDIHEKDDDYLQRTYSIYQWVAANYGWERISCVEQGELKERTAIAAEIVARLGDIF